MLTALWQPEGRYCPYCDDYFAEDHFYRIERKRPRPRTEYRCKWQRHRDYQRLRDARKNVTVMTGQVNQ